MATPSISTPLLRAPVRPLTARTSESGHRQATWLELFFDLCFVVAVAAAARALHADPTWEGALIFVGLFVPIWWAWMGFSWFANTFDNDDVLYRAVVFGAMLAVIWLATSVEAAATGAGFAFALAYIVLRLLLLALMARALRDVSAHPEEHTHAPVGGFLRRYIVWNVLGLVPWIASLAVDDTTRYVLWGVGLVIELFAPYAATHGLGDPSAYIQLFHFDHISERYGLFTIIVLGESILAVSVGIVEVGWNATSMLVASLAFVAAVSIWWTYFDRSGRDALARDLNAAFTWGYGHFAIFAGIAAVGVGTELLIEAAAAGGAELVAADQAAEVAGAAGGLPGTAVLAGGFAAFWVGMSIVNLANLGFRITSVGRVILPLRITVIALLVSLAAATDIEPLPFAAVAAAAILALNATETTVVMRFQRTRAAVVEPGRG